jgi:predicted kinase
MKMIYLLRGLPGAGKSTLADTMAAALHADWWEADDYFMTPDGYVFDATKLHAAHGACYRRVEQSMLFERNVIVSNTFTTEKEMKPYLALAVEHGYAVTSIIVENRHGEESVHGVPEETMDKMRARFSVQL